MKKAKIEKKLAKALFNDKERAVIMNSLYYSVHKYKQHGDTDNTEIRTMRYLFRRLPTV